MQAIDSSSLRISSKALLLLIILEICLLLLTFLVSQIHIYVILGLIPLCVGIYILSSENWILSSLGMAVLTFCILWNSYSLKLPYFIHDFFVGLALLFLVVQLFLGRQSSFRWSSLSTMVLLFNILVLFSIMIGLIYDNNARQVFVEAHNLLYYFIFFPVLAFLRKEREARHLVWLILAAAIFVCLQYFSIIIQQRTFLRVTTYHADMFGFVLGLFFVLFINAQTILQRIVYLVSSMIIVIGLLISYTRAEWVASALGLVIILIFLLRDRKVQRRFWTIFMMVVVLFLIISVYVEKDFLDSLFQKQLRAEFGERLQSVGTPLEDLSLLMRVELSVAAFHQFLQSPIFGVGMGGVVGYKSLGTGKVWSLDTSHLQILWKMGIIGFLAYLGLIVSGLKRSLYVFHRTTSSYFKIFSISVFAGFCGLIVLSFFSAALTKYNLNLVWAILLAILEFEALRIDSQRRSEV